MIHSFQCSETQALFDGKRVARFANFETVALRKLQQLHAATTLYFLRISPGNQLEALKPERRGQHSLRINDQWRVCFVWLDGHASLVELVDYHRRRMTMSGEVSLIHPGDILAEDWLKPLGLSQYALAKAIDVPPRRINEIVKGLRGSTVNTALRLGAFFSTDAQSWVKLQTHFDTEAARELMSDATARIRRFELAST